MEFVLTLNNIFVSDVEKVGYRAVDLSTMARRNYKLPLCFVINSHALEEFVKYNNLMEKGADFLAKGDYKALQQEFMRGTIPEKILSEIRESYESLSVSGGDATSIVATQSSPYVTVVVSPNYLSDDIKPVQNINGTEQLVQSIKGLWASLFGEVAFKHRAQKGIREFFAGIIVQQMPQSVVSATGTLSQSNNVAVETWFGLPEFGLDFEKDHFEVSKEYLRIENQQVKHQVYKLDRNENNVLEKVPLEGTGSKQKLDDKTVVEIGRLTKKMSAELNQGVKAFFTIDKQNIYLLFGDRLEEQTPGPIMSPAETPAVAPVTEVPREDTPFAPTQETAPSIPGETTPEPVEPAPAPEEVPPPVIEKEEPSHIPTPVPEEVPLPEPEVSAEVPYPTESTVPKPTEEVPTPDDVPKPDSAPAPEFGSPEVVEEETKDELPSEEEYEFLDELEDEKVEDDSYQPDEIDVEPEFETVVAEDQKDYEQETPESVEEESEPDEQTVPSFESQQSPEPVSENIPELSLPEPTMPEQTYESEPVAEPVAEQPEPENSYSQAPSEPSEPDERIETVTYLKEMMDELEALISSGDQTEIEHKTNEIHETIKRLKDMSK